MTGDFHSVLSNVCFVTKGNHKTVLHVSRNRNTKSLTPVKRDPHRKKYDTQLLTLCVYGYRLYGRQWSMALM
jgi:hypothetical protein